jgi:C4-dicarboxylate-specific signal transduction histidine kinase
VRLSNGVTVERAMSQIEQLLKTATLCSPLFEPTAEGGDCDLVLSASIAHEIRQPLAGIVVNVGSCLRMLSGELPNVAGAQEAARRAMRDARRATDIVAKLQTLFSERKILSEPIDLNEALCEVLLLSQERLREDKIALELELAEDIPLVGGDRVLIQQVMMNLVRNAADAMTEVNDRPRRLSIRSGVVRSDGVRLVVEDSGPRADLAKFERVFDPLYTTKPKGLGVGLSVCRTIIDAHGGAIWAAAGEPYGAVFQFILPGRKCVHRPNALTKCDDDRPSSACCQAAALRKRESEDIGYRRIR